jgi:hypothetical protein
MGDESLRTPWTQQVLSVVRETAAKMLAEGRAELHASTSRIDLVSTAPQAACLTIEPGAGPPDFDTLAVGEYGTAELSHPLPERLDLLRDLIGAILEGRYSEEVSLSKEGQPARVIAVFDLPSGPWKYDRTFGRRRRTKPTLISYAPY